MSEINTANNGILLLDKPLGWSSHGVVNAVRRITKVKRVGHTGTLDPFATGLLIVLVGRNFTKLQDNYLKQNKTYQCRFELGYETTTLDCEGSITQKANPELLAKIAKPQVLATLQELIGIQQQQAPAFAAIKISGEKLYDHALKMLNNSSAADYQIWQNQLPSREIEIFDIKLLNSRQLNDNLQSYEIEVSCSSGTYIRSLIRDIGHKLQVFATATELKRTKIGNLSLDMAQQVNRPETWKWYQPSDLC